MVVSKMPLHSSVRSYYARLVACSSEERTATFCEGCVRREVRVCVATDGVWEEPLLSNSSFRLQSQAWSRMHRKEERCCGGFSAGFFDGGSGPEIVKASILTSGQQRKNYW